MVKEKTIADRVQFLLDGREKYPWARAIGIDTAIDSITRLGRTPSGETISCIRRAENVRVDWLLEGRGTPYYVTVCASDNSAANELVELLAPETWDVTVVSDGERMAAVLTQPGSFQVKDKRIDYTIIEIVAGALGPKALLEIRNRWMHRHGISKLDYVLVDQGTMSRIENGQVGTYRLIDAPDAILKDRKPATEDHPFLNRLMQVTTTPPSPEEAALLERYRAMSAVNRLAVNQVVSAIAEGSTGTEEKTSEKRQK